MKNFLTKLLIAGKRAYSIPTLPENILKIQSYPIIRIIRFLGGTSFLILVTKAYLNFHFYFLYIFYFFSVLFTIYHFIISFYRFKHMASEIKSDKFDIRNSPLHRFATLGAKALWCFKGVCETAQPLGVTLGIMVTTDQILKESGRDAIFTPIIGGLLNQILPESSNTSSSPSQILKNHFEKIQKNSIEIEDLKKAKDLVQNFSGGLSKEDVNELTKILTENQNELIRDSQKVSEDMIEKFKKIK